MPRFGMVTRAVRRTSKGPTGAHDFDDRTQLETLKTKCVLIVRVQAANFALLEFLESQTAQDQ